MASSFINAFIAPSRGGSAWFPVGPSSSFPNITDSGSTSLSDQVAYAQSQAPGCKVFQVPRTDASSAIQVPLKDEITPEAEALQDQVLIFQYRGKFHAVDNKCPHASFPLSKATPFDIEDFGIVLSAGLTCPKHGWSFDIHSGNGDRGNYKLKLWEVQLRPVAGSGVVTVNGEGLEEKEIWVRRKQRMG